jgi:hypothetical protein
MPWHSRIACLLRSLDDRQATPRLDREEAGGAVVEHPRENHTDKAWAIGVSR